MSDTFLDALVGAVRSASAYNSNDVVAPVALIWTDEAREWTDVAPRLGERIPVLTLGPYDPATLTGPAIWIRCMLARKLAEAKWGEDVVPVVYLPGYSRSSLRAVEDCPEELKALAGFQHLGTIWSQRNGRDWTLSAFLQSSAGGLGIPVASDSQTSEALSRAAVALLDEQADVLRVKAPLRADFFNALLAPDITKQVLLWMNDPDGERARLSPEEWDAFADQCRHELSLDPVGDGEITAARKLGGGQGPWEMIWDRFREAPANYSRIPDLLRKAKPHETGRNLELFERVSSEAWPQDNEFEESCLRSALMRLPHGSIADACREVDRLEEQHRHRRDWVWAQLGRSPLAFAIGHLSVLRKVVAEPLYGGTVSDIAARYSSGGWKADWAALRALSAVRENEDREALVGALRVLYVPWLRGLCESFQSAWQSSPPQQERQPPESEKGVAFVFADGLRMDLAYVLKGMFETEGLSCDIAYRFVPLPSVTGTGKPAASPVAADLFGGPELAPVTVQGTQVNAQVLRNLLAESGSVVLGEHEIGDPKGAVWTECGRVDEIGHIEGWRLAHRVHDELRQVLVRVRALLDAGWRKARVITDHGWLLVPGGLPTFSLPQPTAEIRKGRAARLKLGAVVDCMTVPWFWDPEVRIAVAPGIKCFVAGKEYEHGGISPQEVVVPELVVTSPNVGITVRFEDLKWTGLRCRMILSGATEELMVDLRTRPADPGSSVAEEPKPVGLSGEVSLLCSDDSLEGCAVVAVACAPDRPDRVIAQRPTVIGGDGGGNG